MKTTARVKIRSRARSQMSNEVPLKLKKGRKPGNKEENVEGSKKRQRSSSTGLKEELEVFESTRSEFDSLLDRLVKSELKNITQQGQIDFLKRSNNVFSSEIDNLANKKKQTSWYSWNSERLDQKSRVT